MAATAAVDGRVCAPYGPPPLEHDPVGWGPVPEEIMLDHRICGMIRIPSNRDMLPPPGLRCARLLFPDSRRCR
jgi:hypothetical protein